MKNKSNSISTLVMVGMLWVVFGCSCGSSDSDTKKPTDAGPATLSINAGLLVMEFEGNEVRAKQTYGGKRVRINGTVNSIEVLKDERITLTFHSPAMGNAQTRCYFNSSQSARVAELKGGQEATVEGTVQGIGGGLGGRGFVNVEDCIVP